MRHGVLLVNLGTPAAPTAEAIRPWLAEFLHDYRVVDLSRWIWCPILHGVILPLRPRKLAHAYASIWTAEGSPLLAITRQQGAALQKELGADTPVAIGMRYGSPSIASGLEELKARGAEQINVLPLYPQYSRTTTASVQDVLPAGFTLIEDYHATPSYIAALAESVRDHWQTQGRGEHLLLSFHGIPQRYSDAGDPYAAQCGVTARLLAEALALREDEWTLAYQSRVGRAAWLKPYTDEVIPALAARGVKQLDAVCPGFSADCLETLEEVSQRYGELFTCSGGAALRYIPALNARPAHIAALAGLVRTTLSG